MGPKVPVPDALLGGALRSRAAAVVAEGVESGSLLRPYHAAAIINPLHEGVEGSSFSTGTCIGQDRGSAFGNHRPALLSSPPASITPLAIA